MSTKPEVKSHRPAIAIGLSLKSKSDGDQMKKQEVGKKGKSLAEIILEKQKEKDIKAEDVFALEDEHSESEDFMDMNVKDKDDDKELIRKIVKSRISNAITKR